jgi:hypothetical protein
MLDQVGLEIRKHQSRSQMHLPLKNACEIRRYLIVDKWSNKRSDSVIVIVVAITHDQSDSVLRVRTTRHV